jgi:glycosyltransferase involved in cell wall biosynthesis
VERSRVRLGGETRPYILYAGSLYSGFMGLEACLSAFSQVAADGVQFYVAGEGPYRKQLEHYAEAHSLTDRVRFLGYKPPEEMPDIIRHARLCVIPYASTPLTDLALPKKLFEFMVLGRAILYPDLPGFDEILGKDNPGRYHAGDPEDMKRTLKQLLFDHQVRERAEKMNYERFEAVSYEHEMEKLMAVYEKMCARQRIISEKV